MNSDTQSTLPAYEIVLKAFSHFLESQITSAWEAFDCVFVLVILWFELRALHLLGRC
jgi:hypothetical protein